MSAMVDIKERRYYYCKTSVIGYNREDSWMRKRGREREIGDDEIFMKALGTTGKAAPLRPGSYALDRIRAYRSPLRPASPGSVPIIATSSLVPGISLAAGNQTRSYTGRAPLHLISLLPRHEFMTIRLRRHRS